MKIKLPLLSSFTFVGASVAVAFGGITLFKPHHNVVIKPGKTPVHPANPAVAVVDSPPAHTINLHYPIYDQLFDFYTTPVDNQFDLHPPANIKSDITYDPTTKTYDVTQKIGDADFRAPASIPFDSFKNIQFKRDEHDYFKTLSNANALTQRKGILPQVDVHNDILNKLMGSSKVDIRPNGNVELTFGGNFQNIQNPALTVKQRKYGGFNFDMNIQMNVIGNIGDKLKMNVNYNTQSQFDFDNQVKLRYVGGKDDIIKSIEAGNVSFPLPTQLITGSSNVFGLKTALQFGRLTVTSVVSQQKTQKQSLTIQGGAQQQDFQINADEYDENRNYFLAQYFRGQYDHAMSTLPIISSAANVTRIEVWVTNKTNQITDNRDIIAFMDMGENQVTNSNIGHTGGRTNPYPCTDISVASKNSNDLYYDLTTPGSSYHDQYRSLDNAITALENGPLGLVPVRDFEKTRAKKLTSNEYTFIPQLGVLMLNQQLQPDEVLAVAYQYTLSGKVYQVGEFSQDVPPNADHPNVLFLKLLKSTSGNPNVPLWKLQMKNIYSLKAYQISADDFHLDVTYQDPTGGERRFLPKGNNLSEEPLISVLGLDRLNTQLDPNPDGLFDFVPGFTILPQTGKVIFPVLEPFGSDLASKFTNPADVGKYVYQVLYDSTKTKALQFPELDRFVIKGHYKSSVASDISLGAFNIPQGSVKVTAGGQNLTEGTDFTVDYNLGRLKILNQGVLNSGVPINVSFENNDQFGFNVKSLFGTRLDYYVSDKLKLGGTFMHLSERPYTKKLNIGDDPISNSIYGMDLSYATDAGWLTRALDALPLLSTKEKSTINFNAEFAHFIPGHSKAIGKSGTVYIDDFEGTQSDYDLKFPFSSWVLSSTPSEIQNANLLDTLVYGYNRAKLSWYSIDPLFQRDLSSTPSNIKGNYNEQYQPYTYEVYKHNIFKGYQTQSGVPDNVPTFDLSFDPQRRGPYNFSIAQRDPLTGNLLNPQARWGGIMRALDYNDFEQSNIEYIEFWMLDPNIGATGHRGTLNIELGDISEDILKDGRMFYENGLAGHNSAGVVIDQTNWSNVCRIPPTVNSFSSDPADRALQDVGYDGVADANENSFYKDYIGQLQTNYPGASWIQQEAADPSNDDYRYYLDPAYEGDGILARYDKYNQPDGNSPVNTGNTISFSETNIPESEDLNHDNTLNENESYFLYKLNMDVPDLDPGNGSSSNKAFLTDTVNYDVVDPNGGKHASVTWYHFKIPINSFTSRVGTISDFKSIRFMRMYLTGYDNPVIMRFMALQFVRNQWRQYAFSLQNPGEYIPDDNNNDTYFNVSSVSLEENASKSPVNYVIPPGIDREVLVGSTSNTLQNESALSVQVCNLKDGDSRAVFKTINMDLRTFDSLNLFVHAEAVEGNPLADGQLTAFVRLGSDFISNYYEYEVPLTLTKPGVYNNDVAGDRLMVWPDANNIDISLDQLTQIKTLRNTSSWPLNKPYVVTLSNGRRVTIVGNPDLGQVKDAMLGIRNPKQGSGDGDNDDGLPKCAEIWFNEMRLSGFKENGGWAALARTDIKLADFGNVTLSGALHTVGFGQLEQKLDERFKDNFIQYDAAGTFQLGKLVPKKLGLQLPLYVGYSQSTSNPQYDPYVLDILLKDELKNITDATQRAAVKKAAQTAIAIKSLNFTNVRLAPQGGGGKTPFSLSNINLTYAYTNTLKHNPTYLYDNTTLHHGEFAYLFPGKELPISPFAKLISAKTKWFKLIRDANLNLLPTNWSFRTMIDRSFNETQLRPVNPDDPLITPYYNKFLTNQRIYGLKFNPFKSLQAEYNGTANARVDEPNGRIDTPEKRDSVFNNLKSGGRLITYQHSININYAVPLNKLPLTDWTTLTARYASTYNWTATPRLRDPNTNLMIDNPWGNTIANTKDIQLNGELNFRNLYAKFKWLKQFDTNAQPKPAGGKDQKDAKDLKSPPDSKNPKPGSKPQPPQPNTGPVIRTPQGFLIRTLLSLKRVTVTYSEHYNSTIPGFIYSPNFAGMNLGKSAPGWDFVNGYQPDSNWLYRKANGGWFSTDTTLNMLLVQGQSKDLQARASLEPIKDVMIDLTATRKYIYNASEYFKIDGTTDQFKQQNRIESGNLNFTVISWKTAFKNPDNTFSNFENYREIISQRLGASNPFSGANSSFSNPQTGSELSNYRAGYGPYSTDVLIPAFLAAYTGADPAKVKTGGYFNRIPLPNWRITYNGLSKLKFLKRYFSSFNITHNYTSNFSIGNFSSSLNYEAQSLNNFLYESKIDSASGNFFPYYDIPGISLTEQFAPLLGLDVTWKKGFTTKLEYKKSRNLAMSFVDNTLTENSTKEITFNFGYKWKNFKIPFKINRRTKRLKNDIDMKCGISFSDNKTIPRRLDIPQSLPSQGTKLLRINPTIDYVVNKSLQIQLFYDKTFSTPATSASFPITTTNLGIKVRFTLAQ